MAIISPKIVIKKTSQIFSILPPFPPNQNFWLRQWFVAWINVAPLSGAGTIFGQRGGGAENLKYKFRFAPKLPIICIYQKCSMGVGLLHILKSRNLNGVWGQYPQNLTIIGINYQSNQFLSMF